MIAGKATFFLTALVIPSFIHGVPLAVTFYLAVSVVVGLALSIVFQLAHCVEERLSRAHKALERRLTRFVKGGSHV